MPRRLLTALPLDTTWAADSKPLPHLPSPTLTNPDHILPSRLPKIASPPRVTRRPPSPDYLRDRSRDDSRIGGAPAKKEKLGLVSRKMMLLRGRTASGGQLRVRGWSRGSQSQDSASESEPMPSSPILQDVRLGPPEQPRLLQLPLVDSDGRSASGGSSSSDLSGMAAFFAKYETSDSTSDDERLSSYEVEEDPVAPAEEAEEPEESSSRSRELDVEMDAERKKQQLEEYNSALLSKRAEQILANAKKRLNVMEGNLRGARDLVAPLTAANLKRATSVGSAQMYPTTGRRYVSSGYDYEGNQQSSRVLHAQASSPTIGRDYYNHARGFSETELPERSQTSLDYPYNAYHTLTSNPRTAAQRVVEGSNRALRSTRSYDTIGHGAGRERPLHARDSPDSGYLEPLEEADETRRSYRESGATTSNNGLGMYRPSSRTSDLREQMSSLKGKISNLKERAREEALRRQSESNLRNASPFNNAMANAPEFYYTSSSSGHGSPVRDTTNARAGLTSASNSPASAHFPTSDSRAPLVSGSRNAFAEQAAAKLQHATQQARVVEVSKAPRSRPQTRQEKEIQVQQSSTTHRRTPSGSAVIEPARSRYSHHQKQSSQDIPRTTMNEDGDDEAYLEVPPPEASNERRPSPSGSSGEPSGPRVSAHIDDDYAPSEDGASVYEDAASVVAHEDRADAFDYEHFFLHSAMGTYRGDRRESTYSEVSESDVSESSVETAKGPAHLGNEDEEYDDEEFDDRTAEFPPPTTPETPEHLREIEAKLNQRRFSDESVCTVATYATADEDLSSPVEELDRGISPPVRSPTVSGRRLSYTHPPLQRPISRPSSRPGTALQVKRALPSDSSSDRADSGVGLPRRFIPHPGPMTPKVRRPTTTATSAITPPTSPRVQLDPAAVAVNALLDANAPGLGLRNKAVLFSVVESLRKVVKQLQELDETSYDSRELRGRLDEAKFMLDGRGEQ